MTNEQISARLRQVLELIAQAPADWTTIPGDPWPSDGEDQFVGVKLIEDAKAMLARWDDEDTSAGQDSGGER